MNRGIGILIGLAIFLVAILSIRCNEGESPVSFTPDLPNLSNLSGSSSSSNNNSGGGEEVTPPTPPENPPLPTGMHGRFLNYAVTSVQLLAENLTPTQDKTLFLVCYLDPTGKLEDQSLIDDWESRLVEFREIVRMKIDLPACHWQCDAITNIRGPKTPPYYTPRELVAFSTSRQRDLDLPNECPPPPSPPSSPPPPSPPPPPPPECPEPTSERPGDECVWNTETCEWECQPPPPCEPTGEPECEEQLWDLDSCSWVGACPPPPTPFCHVYVGNDDNSEDQIIETQLFGNPDVPAEHEPHFNRCPPDYLGFCDERSLQVSCDDPSS